MPETSPTPEMFILGEPTNLFFYLGRLRIGFLSLATSSMPSDVESLNFCGLNFFTKASTYLTKAIADISLINIVVIFVQRITVLSSKVLGPFHGLSWSRGSPGSMPGGFLYQRKGVF